MNSTASIAKVHGKPTLAASTPARAGPTVSMVPNEMPLSALARVTISGGRMRPTTEPRVAIMMVPATELTVVTT